MNGQQNIKINIRALFNDVISILCCIAANGGDDVNNELERIWKEVVVAFLFIYLFNLLLRKSCKYI